MDTQKTLVSFVYGIVEQERNNEILKSCRLLRLWFIETKLPSPHYISDLDWLDNLPKPWTRTASMLNIFDLFLRDLVMSKLKGGFPMDLISKIFQWWTISKDNEKGRVKYLEQFCRCRQNILGNSKHPKYKEKVCEILQSYEKLVCNMSILI